VDPLVIKNLRRYKSKRKGKLRSPTTKKNIFCVFPE